jgi:hypothetical protein
MCLDLACLPSTVQPNKVYVGGLPEHTRQEDLQSCFGKIGNIVNIELKSVFLSLSSVTVTNLMGAATELDMVSLYVYCSKEFLSV